MSTEDDYVDKSKPKSRMSGACDLCRQKKIRCDSATRAPGDKCSNCVKAYSECTHVHVNQKIGQGYRNALSTSSELLSLAKLRDIMDPLLKSVLLPTYQAPTNPSIIRETMVSLARYARSLEAAVPSKSPDPKPNGLMSPSNNNNHFLPMPVSAKQDIIMRSLAPSEDKHVTSLAEGMKRSLMLTGSGERFFGHSSGISLLKSAIDISAENPGFPRASGVGVLQLMRPVFWSVLPWEQAPRPDTTALEFPEPDLMHDLIEVYFSNVDVFLPVLHRPTFERKIAAGLHISDPEFGGTLLGVCAVAARYSNDERVLLEGTGSTHSAGFKWYRQIRHFHESSLQTPSLYHLQSLYFAITYLKGSSTPEKCWYLIGFGIRAAHDIGLNQKVKEGTPITVEGELKKRVYWNLLGLEWAICTATGRVPSIHSSDFFVDLPVACDDEFWEHPDPYQAFKQPPGKPSKASFFNALIPLIKIHCAAQQYFYPNKRPEPPPGMSQEDWDRSKLSEIDSSLNAWVDSVPDHLRWDGKPKDPIHYDQSALLYSTFYYVQISVHRQFVATQEEPSLAFTSLAICTNAARACIRIMGTQAKKGLIPSPQIEIALFISGLMILLNIFRQRRTGLGVVDEAKEAKSVHTAINVLKMYENRWHPAGRFCDLLVVLASIGGLALEPTVTRAVKRRRNDQEQEDEQRDAKRHSKSPELVHKPLSTMSVMHSPTFSTLSTPAFSNGPGSPPSDHDSPGSLPFYSSELSKPFFDFGVTAEGDNAAFQKQLEELEAMMGDAQRLGNPGSPQPNSSAFPMQQIYGQLARQSAFSTMPTQVVPIGCYLPPMDNSIFENNHVINNLLDNQAASLWTGLPSGTEWADWSNYITNMEVLNNSQDLSAAISIPIPSFNGVPQAPAQQPEGKAQSYW